MSKHAAVEFERQLDHLFQKHTADLRALVRPGPRGPKPRLSKVRLLRAIDNLKDLASDCLVVTLAKKNFGDLRGKPKQWHVTRRKGWGWKAKRDSFEVWFDKNIPYLNCVYAFWSGHKCLYIGSTGRGRGRPRQHFGRSWFGSATRIDIYPTSRASEVAKLECLGIHRWKPTENERLPAAKRYTKRCPVCEVHKKIDRQLRKVFRLR